MARFQGMIATLIHGVSRKKGKKREKKREKKEKKSSPLCRTPLTPLTMSFSEHIHAGAESCIYVRRVEGCTTPLGCRSGGSDGLHNILVASFFMLVLLILALESACFLGRLFGLIYEAA